MQQAIYLVQVVLALLLIVVILVQQKGTGLGSTFGGELAFYRTKRGAEKMLFYATIILASLFILLSIISLLI